MNSYNGSDTVITVLTYRGLTMDILILGDSRTGKSKLAQHLKTILQNAMDTGLVKVDEIEIITGHDMHGLMDSVYTLTRDDSYNALPKPNLCLDYTLGGSK
ncbi:hypothetical protein S144_72 [Shewanella sp. phage 1/44]|uniref:hypothetical protein n=1 Tax=Shewanella sp. phage 1/44 TaxID=1458862 RepID=UPI0004F809B7|nr:hypothetical protein S144_72 [Shewanella sp. phage 1/44]AHK11786.1 hypothetical protein S144_72 [Shewanella sp. phage 1/44]